MVIPAIYHLEAKVIIRSVGRSAAAASAYMSCNKITNQYDDLKHDYTKKEDVSIKIHFMGVMRFSDVEVLEKAKEAMITYAK